jgi:hypothetical protein
MQVMQEIASLSGDELEALKAYRSTAAGQAGNLEQLVNKFTDLSNQRQVAYERYLELAGVNK